MMKAVEFVTSYKIDAMENIDPEMLSQNPTRLNEQQLQMLRLFKEPLDEEDYNLIKREILFLKAKKIDLALEQWERENNILAKTMNDGAMSILGFLTTRNNEGCS